MPFATSRTDQMFTARNLNSLYSRADQKCARVLDGKSPLFANSAAGVWEGQYPYGVWYVFRNDPASCRRLRDTGTGIPGIGAIYRDNHDQTQVAIELSKLENQYLDTQGGQVYVDHPIIGADPFTCDIGTIHFSFELLTREVNGVRYDIHLGWDPDTGNGTSYVRGSLGAAIDPTLPPGRIHKHRLAVAEIALEGQLDFRIPRSYQRFDCYRVHNCNPKAAVVYLQMPDGSTDRQFVAAGACRTFRRRPDGTWAYRWPGGDFSRYFFPCFSGDIPFLAEGPPSWSKTSTQSEFLALERSSQANNVANPFIINEWRRVMQAVYDPYLPYDIRQVYSGVYADPTDANTTIGNAVFTWGRARVIYTNAAGDVYDDQIRIFTGTIAFADQIKALGVDVTVNPTDITMVSRRGTIRIYPVDANIFTTTADPFWEITTAGTTISTVYPAQYTTETPGSGTGTVTWTGGNEPTIFESMRDLRRRVAVELGFLNTYDEVVDISEEKVSLVTMTPAGLSVRGSTSYGIDGNLLVNFETTATNDSLWIDSRPVGFGVGPWQNFRFTSGTKSFLLAVPGAFPGLQWGNVLPARSCTSTSGAIQQVEAVNSAFIPPGGPWGFSSSVYDFDLVRAYQIDMAIGSTDDRPWGGDFWRNKWGGPNGSDASVRIPGSPNQTQQFAFIPEANNSSFVDLTEAGADDIFKDQRQASFASTVPFVSLSYLPPYRDNMTTISWTGGVEQVGFLLPYNPIENPYQPGGGPFFHKIPKSAWLWNLLEWTIRSWTRAVPLCQGQGVCPIYDAGNLYRVGDLLTFGTGQESGGTIPSYYVSEAGHDILIANGVVAYKDQDAGGNDYWYVPAVNLATYCDSRGFFSWNFDTENGEPNIAVPVASTAYIPLRNYGTGERSQSGGYFDVTAGADKYLSIRYVDLRLPNELSA